MDDNMGYTGREENLIVRGVKPRTWGFEAKRKAQRAIHGVVVSVESGAKIAATCSASGAPWWYDQRRNKRSPYAEPLRVVDVLVESGAPVEQCEQPGEILKCYARERCEERDGNQSPQRVA